MGLFDQQKPAPGSFLSLLQDAYGSSYRDELKAAREFNKTQQFDLVMPEPRAKLANDSLVNKPVTVAKEGTFPVDGQARFMANPVDQKRKSSKLHKTTFTPFNQIHEMDQRLVLILNRLMGQLLFLMHP